MDRLPGLGKPPFFCQPRPLLNLLNCRGLLAGVHFFISWINMNQPPSFISCQHRPLLNLLNYRGLLAGVYDGSNNALLSKTAAISVSSGVKPLLTTWLTTKTTAIRRSCPRDWRLSASGGSTEGPPETPVHQCTHQIYSCNSPCKDGGY